jgi:hypothetical protein
MFDVINKTIMRALGVSELPLEKQHEAMEMFGEIIYKAILFRALENMSDQDKNEFEKILDADADMEAIFRFLATKVSDIDTIAKEEAGKLRNEDEELMSQIGTKETSTSVAK